MNNSQFTADLIKKVAKLKKISVSKLLSDCALNKNALYTMQSEGYYPRVEALVRIAEYLDCSVDYLLGRTDNPTIGTGSNNINQSNVNSDNSIVSVNSDSSDELMQEFLSSFKELSFSDKIKAMDYVNKLNSKK